MRAQARAQTAAASCAATDATALRLGRAAVAALHDELALAPKPGLVSFVDSGSHDDMNARTFMRSLFALRHTFPRLAALGAAGAPLAALQAEGRAAEARMLHATGGVNTHRGAIFTLGLLCAAAGRLQAAGADLDLVALRGSLLSNWGAELAGLAAARERDAASHGADAARRFGLRGAAREAALGFPVLFETTLPALRAALQQGQAAAPARLHALLHTIAALDDTNLAHRGGLAGLRHAQAQARACLAAGGAADRTGVAALHRDFVARRLSPGGAADLLAAACWVQRIGALA